MLAVASAMPSMRPTVATLRPRVAVMNKGSSAWMISDDTSMQRLTRPSAQTVRGKGARARSAADTTGSRRAAGHRPRMAAPAGKGKAAEVPWCRAIRRLRQTGLLPQQPIHVGDEESGRPAEQQEA